MRTINDRRQGLDVSDWHVTIYQSHLLPHGVCEIGDNSGGTNHDRHRRSRRQLVRYVNLRTDDRRERVVLNMVHDSYDDGPVALEFIRASRRVGNVELSADRVAIGPELARKNIINDDSVLMRGIIGLSEIAAFEETGAYGTEIPGQNRAVIRHFCVLQ